MRFPGSRTARLQFLGYLCLSASHCGSKPSGGKIMAKSKDGKTYWRKISAAAAGGMKPALLLTLIALLAFGGLRMTKASAVQTRQRPLSDFINAQGTSTCFTPPAPAQIGASTTFTNQTTARFSLFDYTGLTAKFLSDNFGISLGTTV